MVEPICHQFQCTLTVLSAPMWHISIFVLAAIWDKLEVLFVAFSGYSNMKRLFRIRNLHTDLPTLDCVRFLSFSWSVLGYTWVLGPIVAECWLSGKCLSYN